MHRSSLVNTKEISEIIGLSRRYVTDNVTKRPDFPAPVVNITRKTRLWSRSSVFEYLSGRRGKRF